MKLHACPGVLDVAIVGGGVSGCYCGYRLLTAVPVSPIVQNMPKASGRDSLSVALYEASDRIGGRPQDFRFPETPDLVADLGGMCSSPLNAKVYGLCTRIAARYGASLQVQGTQSSIHPAASFQFSRLSLYTPTARRTIITRRVVPYFLDKNEKWHLPTDLMLAAFKDAVPTAAALLDELRKEGGDPEKAWTLSQNSASC